MHFGPDPNNPPPPMERHPISVAFKRGDKVESHSFQAMGVADVSLLNLTLRTAKAEPQRALDAMLRIIARAMDNDDGVPAQWEPRELPQRAVVNQPAVQPRGFSTYDQHAPDGYPRQADPFAHHSAMGPGDTRVVTEPEWSGPCFRGPDGNIYPMDRVEEFTDVARGSSRRRWLHCMETDDELSIDEGTLKDMFEWITKLAGKGRTPAS